jgi:hypothetical protein
MTNLNLFAIIKIGAFIAITFRLAALNNGWSEGNEKRKSESEVTLDLLHNVALVSTAVRVLCATVYIKTYIRHICLHLTSHPAAKYQQYY